MIFRANIPDFIIDNEKNFVNQKSIEYKNFINNKIKYFFSHEHEFKIVPSCIIWLKLCKLFNSYSLMIMYNRMLNSIKHFPHEICYHNYIYIKNELNEIKVIENENEVYSSCLFDAHECFQINEFLSIYIEKILVMKNYNLLNSELDMLDTHNLNDSKYDNLKYLIFRTGLVQWQYKYKNDKMDFSKVIDFSNYPQHTSIRFSLFIAWALCQVKLGIDIKSINYIPNPTLNIELLYNYYIYLINNKLVKTLFDWIMNFNWDEYDGVVSEEHDDLGLLKTFEVSTIFDENNNIHKTYYDYPTNLDIKIIDVLDGNYKLKSLNNEIDTSIYDDLNEFENIDEDNTFNNSDNSNGSNDSNGGIDNIVNKKLTGGNQENIIGVHKLKNNFGKIISSVPIAKISNILQWCNEEIIF